MAAKDTDADFEQWYPTAHRQVLAALIAYSGAKFEAEEAVDEAFARAYWRWDRVRGMRSPEGWAFVVARNLLRGSARRQERRRGETTAPAHQPDLSDQVLAALDIAERLSVLTPRQREIVVLHHGLDVAQEDVATALGISRSTVASTLRDVRLVLERRAGDPDTVEGERQRG